MNATASILVVDGTTWTLLDDGGPDGQGEVWESPMGSIERMRDGWHAASECERVYQLVGTADATTAIRRFLELYERELWLASEADRREEGAYDWHADRAYDRWSEERAR